MVSIRINGAASFEKHTAVTTFSPTNEENEIVRGSETSDVFQPICHLTANGIGVAELDTGSHALLNDLNNLSELRERFGRLRVEKHGAREINTVQFLDALYHNSLAACLPHKTKHFGMTFLAKDDNLRINARLSIAMNALLDAEHHRTCGINKLDVVGAGYGIGLRRLTVGSQQYTHVVKMTELLVIDGDKSHPAQAFTFLAVVDNVAQRIERHTAAQFLLGLADGGRNAKAESTALVNLDYHVYSSLHTRKYCPISHSFCWGMVRLLLSSRMASSA